MNHLATYLLGPLCGPECRRALARGWLILVRGLAATAAFGVALVAYWVWWIGLTFNPYYKPTYELRIGLIVVEGMLVTIAMVLGPAVMAGSLAGEKERGVLGLLLTTRVRSREIVTGRLTGKLTQVAMILLAGLPALMMLAGLAGVSGWRLLVYVLLPAAVAVGGGGLAAVASTLSRKGRDALLSVYLIDLFFMLSPLSRFFGLPSSAFDWVVALNPYVGLDDLGYHEDVTIAVASIGLWLLIGVAGVAVASWRLRPSCLKPLDGERVAGRRKRRFAVPPVDEARPMLWKELHIERVATLGRFGRYAGVVIVLGLGAGSVVLTVLTFLDPRTAGGYELADWARERLEAFVGGSGTILACLIQWAIGLRAAVSISSERERGTWDALLTSPLDARSIVLSKLWGSLFALRWLILAAFLAWTLAAASGAIDVLQAVRWGADVLIVGSFMAAVGVRTSVSSPTATRAMSITIGIWLASIVAVWFVAAVVMAVGFILLNAIWLAATQAGMMTSPTAGWVIPFTFRYGWPVATNLTYLVATVLIVADTRVRFDRLAGRMTEGGFAVAVDDLIYGRPADEFLPEPSAVPFGAEPRPSP